MPVLSLQLRRLLFSFLLAFLVVLQDELFLNDE